MTGLRRKVCLLAHFDFWYDEKRCKKATANIRRPRKLELWLRLVISVLQISSLFSFLLPSATAGHRRCQLELRILYSSSNQLISRLRDDKTMVLYSSTSQAGYMATKYTFPFYIPYYVCICISSVNYSQISSVPTICPGAMHTNRSGNTSILFKLRLLYGTVIHE